MLFFLVAFATPCSSAMPPAKLGKDPRQRLAPDPSVGVSDLEKVMSDFVDKQGTSDLSRLLHTGTKVGWKTTADPEWLGHEEMKGFYIRLFKVATNGVLQSSKLKTSLLKTQSSKGRHNYTKQHDHDWADALDDLIRVGAAHLRELKKDTVKYHRLVKRCALQETRNIDSVLAVLSLSLEGLENQGSMCTSPKPLALKEIALKEAEDLVVGITVFPKFCKSSDPASPSFC